MRYFVLQSATRSKTMPSASPTISLRLSEETKARLTRAAKLTRRSRSFLVKEALEKHLDAILSEQSAREAESRLARLMAFKGAGARIAGERTAAEIDAQVRAFRGDD